MVLRRVLPSNFIYEYDLKAFFNSFYLWKLHEALEKSGLPESINQHVYNMNDNDATPPTSEDIHDSDPELAEYEVRDYRYGGGVNRQRVREAFLVGEGQTGPNRLRRHWSQSPLKGITQGVN